MKYKKLIKVIHFIRDVIAAAILIILVHITCLIKLIKLVIGKILLFAFKLVIALIFGLLLLLSAFNSQYINTWSGIKQTCGQFVDLICETDYQDLVQWYKGMFAKEEKKEKAVY